MEIMDLSLKKLDLEEEEVVGGSHCYDVLL